MTTQGFCDSFHFRSSALHFYYLLLLLFARNSLDEATVYVEKALILHWNLPLSAVYPHSSPLIIAGIEFFVYKIS